MRQGIDVLWHILTFIVCVTPLPGGAAFSLGPRHSLPARLAAAVERRTTGVQNGGCEFARAAFLPRGGSRRVHPRQESPRCAQEMKGNAGDDTGGQPIAESAWKIIKDERTGAPSFSPFFSPASIASHATSSPASSPTSPSRPPPTAYSSPHDPLLQPTAADRPIRQPIDE